MPIYIESHYLINDHDVIKSQTRVEILFYHQSNYPLFRRPKSFFNDLPHSQNLG